MKTFPIAKINLGLNVVGKRADGYHDLETVFYPLPLRDELQVTPALSGSQGAGVCKLRVEGMPEDEDSQTNLVVKAYKALCGIYPLPSVEAVLRKRIPIQAGLGGGSSDAAYMLRTLNDMFSLGLTTELLELQAAKLGADCAFFIEPKPKFATGIGDKFQSVDVDLSSYKLLVVKPKVAISTKEAFQYVTPMRPEISVREIVKMEITKWRTLLVNDFEKSAFAVYPELRQLKRRLYDMGALYASMSGSGSAFFGIFQSEPKAWQTAFQGCGVWLV